MNDPDRQAALAETAADRRLAAVYQYWCALSGDHDVPVFSRLDPIDLPPSVLPYVTLFDVIDGGRSFRVRLVGTGTTAAVGCDPTGANLDIAADGEILAAALERYRAVLMHRRPIADIARYELSHGPSIKTRHLTVPFSTNASVIDRLLGVYSPSSAPDARSILRNLAIPADARVTRSRIVL